MFWLLVMILCVTTYLDFYSTFEALRLNPNVHEGNPLVAWAVKRGKVVTFLFIYGVTAAFCWMVWWMKSPGEMYTRIWWIPLFAGSVVHFYMFFNNRKFYKNLK